MPGEVRRPKVSVVMSVYNDEAYLSEAIESILNQTFTDFEFLITNDGSTDSSRDIILSYKDPRIGLVDNEDNLGLPVSLNNGIRLARGEYVARQDADDISLPERLEHQVSLLDNKHDVGLVGCHWKLIDIDGRVFSQGTISGDHASILEALIPNRVKFPHGCYFVRKHVLDSIGGYDERFFYTQDYDLLLRISQSFHLSVIPSPLYKLRVRSSSSNLKTLCQAEYRSFARQKYDNGESSVAIPPLAEIMNSVSSKVQVRKNSQARYWYSLARQTGPRNVKKTALYLTKACWQTVKSLFGTS